MNNLKILCINWRDIKSPDAGGAEVYIHKICSIWANHGHSITFFATRYKGCLPYEDIDGIHIIRKGDWRLFNLTAFFYYKKVLEKQGFDVVIDNISKVPLFSPLFIKRPLIGIFYHRHGLTLFEELSFIPAAIIFLLESIAPLFYNNIKIITISESTKQELMNLGVNPYLVSIIHSGIDSSLYKPNIALKEKYPVFIYLGRLKRYKRIDYIIRAFDIVYRIYPRARLYIAGTGNYINNLKRLVKKLGIEKGIEFFGYVSEEKKIELLQRSWAYICSSMKEGWGISLIEANACGTPVIAANVSGIRDAVKDGQTGILVPFGNINAMSKAMLNIIEDESTRMNLTNLSIEWAKNFNWERTASSIMDVLKSTIASSHN